MARKLMQAIIGEYFSNSVKQTEEIAKKIVKELEGNIIAFIGNLGAGKTTMIKSMVNHLNDTPKTKVCSPTFNYLNIYNGKTDVFHFDLYRIQDENQFLSIGFEEYFSQGICIIEWAEKIMSLLPLNTIVIHLIYEKEESRKITVLKL